MSLDGRDKEFAGLGITLEGRAEDTRPVMGRIALSGPPVARPRLADGVQSRRMGPACKGGERTTKTVLIAASVLIFSGFPRRPARNESG